MQFRIIEDTMFRKILKAYRWIQYLICGRQKYGVMPKGQLCYVEPFKIDINHGDVVHPCVRYIPGGYEGHCWWLVYTPYYGAAASMENPILCYSESNELDPPTEWKVYCEVNGKPEKGYNSDPVLLYDKGKLYVFWREYGTEKVLCSGHAVATFGGLVHKGQIIKEIKPLVWSDDLEIDAEVSPTFLRREDRFVCYAMHLQFHSKWVKHIKQPWRKLVERVLLITGLLGLYSQEKHFGVSIWEGDALDNSFNYMKTIKFRNCCRLYRPWHMDFFDWAGNRYAVVQTNKCNADLCLAVSDDNEHFTFYKKPLITNASIGKLGIYKPTAGVVGDMFFLYYTAQDPNNRALNKLYVTTIPKNTLLSFK